MVTLVDLATWVALLAATPSAECLNLRSSGPGQVTLLDLMVKGCELKGDRRPQFRLGSAKDHDL